MQFNSIAKIRLLKFSKDDSIPLLLFVKVKMGIIYVLKNFVVAPKVFY